MKEIVIYEILMHKMQNNNCNTFYSISAHDWNLNLIWNLSSIYYTIVEVFLLIYCPENQSKNFEMENYDILSVLSDLLFPQFHEC